MALAPGDLLIGGQVLVPLRTVPIRPSNRRAKPARPAIHLDSSAVVANRTVRTPPANKGASLVAHTLWQLIDVLDKARQATRVVLRLIAIDPKSLEGPIADDTVRPGGMACRLRAWGPGQWYPFAETDLSLTLSEFPDPDGEFVYFKIPNPNLDSLVEDELVLVGSE